MKRFRAFSLLEILTSMMLQASFVIVLMMTFYLLVDFQSANTKLITAREKGQRILAYIENRIIHAGLGLWKCSSSSEIRGAFGNNFPAFDNITLPIAVTNSSNTDLSNSNGWSTTNTSLSGGVYRGNILTVLYTVPYPGTTKVTAIYNNNASGAVETISGDVRCRFLDGSYIVGGSSSNPNKLTDYIAGDQDDLRSYKVTPSSGAPLYINSFASGSDFTLTTKFTAQSVDIASGSQLMTFQCEKMYVVTGSSASERTFTRVNLSNYSEWSAAESVLGVNKSYENGILEVYFELDTNNNILDCYVLVSGGRDMKLDTQRPKSWPSSAKWNANEYKYHELYVSRASWKLHNIVWTTQTAWQN